MNSCSDENLVAACRQGNKDAYASLVERHYKIVFAVCIGTLGNIHDAEDIAQDAMVRGFMRIRTLRKSDQFRAWILRIAKNLCIDYLRRQQRTRTLLGNQAKQSRGTENENMDLQHGISRLPQKLRLALVMYYFENKNAKIIAEKLNISHSGACKRIRDARKQLHEFLTQEV